jgi:ankyrin repeat protein
MLKGGITTLFDICRIGDLLSAVDIPQLPSLARLRDDDDMSLLDVAISYRHMHLVVHLCNTHYLETALGCQRAMKLAALTDDPAIVDRVLSAIHARYEAKRFIHACNIQRIVATAFDAACYEGKLHSVRWLLEAAPDVVLRDEDDTEPVDEDEGHFLDFTECMDAVYEWPDDDGYPGICDSDFDGKCVIDVDRPLLKTWAHGHLGVVRELLDWGAQRHLWRSGKLFLAVVERSSYGEARGHHGGDRAALLELLISTGAVWDADEDEFWEDILEYGGAALACRMVDNDGADSPWHLANVVRTAMEARDAAAVCALLEVAERRRVDLDDNKLFDYALRYGLVGVAESLLQRPAVDMSAECRAQPAPGSDDEDDDYEPDYEVDWCDYEPLRRPGVFLLAVDGGSAAITAAMLRYEDIRQAVNKQYDRLYSRYTVLSHASDPAVIQLLLHAKADVNPADCDTVLRGACQELRPDAVQMLLEAGAEVNRHGSDKPALFYAVYTECPSDRVGEQIALVNLLFDAGANVRDANSGKSILHVAGMWDRIGISHVLDALLARDPALARYCDDAGATALMLGVREPQANLSTIKALIGAGADPNARDHEGISVMGHLLEKSPGLGSEVFTKARELMPLLIAAGYNYSACSAQGKTLLMWMLSHADYIDHRDRIRVLPCDADVSGALEAALEAIAARLAAGCGREERKAGQTQVDEQDGNCTRKAKRARR